MTAKRYPLAAQTARNRDHYRCFILYLRSERWHYSSQITEEILISIALGLLLIRLAVGLTLAGHGVQKLFGWFGGFGLKGTGSWMDSIGLKPGLLIALLAGSAELAGGLLFALGLWIPVASTLIVLTMLGTIVAVHGRYGYWIAQNGMEYNVILIAAAVGIALIGPGDYAIGR